MDAKEIKERAARLGLPETSTEEVVVTREKELGMRDAEGRLVTQDAIDKIYKELKDEKAARKVVEDKLNKAEGEKVNLVTKLKTISEKGLPRKPVVTPLREIYNEDVLPQTEEEWQDLHDEDPNLWADLRQVYNEKRRATVKEVQTAAQKIQEEHKDMFMIGADGNFILDDSGRPQIDGTTEKGKVFQEVVGDDPLLLKVKGGLEKCMEITLARLKAKDEGKVKEQLDKEREEAEMKRKEKVKAGGVASGGGTPPPPPKVEVKFNSKEEEAHVERQIAKGIYKDKEHYCRIRDNKEIPYGRGGF